MQALRTAKLYAQKLNDHLDDIDLPSNYHERVHLLSKMLHVSPEKIRYWLNGTRVPTSAEQELLSAELGVDIHLKHAEPHLPQ